MVFLVIILIVFYLLSAYQMMSVIDGINEESDSLEYHVVDTIVIVFWFVIVMLQIINKLQKDNEHE